MAEKTSTDSELAQEFDFLKAQEAYRRAKRSGDAEAERAAEEAWRQLVRRELQGS